MTRLVAAGFDGRYLFVADLEDSGERPPELYHVAGDPRLEHELSAEPPALLSARLAAFRRWRAERSISRTPERELSSEQAEELE